MVKTPRRRGAWVRRAIVSLGAAVVACSHEAAAPKPTSQPAADRPPVAIADSCERLLSEIEQPVWIQGTVGVVRISSAGLPQFILEAPTLLDGGRFLRADWLRLSFPCSNPRVELLRADGSVGPGSFAALAEGARAQALVGPDFTIAGDGLAFRVRLIE